MKNKIKNIFTAKELLSGNFGIERESLRVDNEGKLSLRPHPSIFGDKIKNPYITTDFSESQIELITPTFNTIEEVYNFLNGVYDIAALELDNEYLWPQSMPCIIPEEGKIPIATYAKEGEEARKYRENLLKKYGGKKQLISGIHYNFSFNEDFIKKLYNTTDKSMEYRFFKDSIYLKIARNYLRYRWLLIYLLGGTAVLHGSYSKECVDKLDKIAEDSYSNEGAVSYRNSECGYKNIVDLYPNYSSVEEYVKSVQEFIGDKLIESHKELYSQIRLKPKDNNNFLESLMEDGINYLEYRSIDINPFSKGGISLEDLTFVHLFNLYLLFKEEGNYDNWQEEALENQRIIAKFGQKEVTLKREGHPVFKSQWAMEIIKDIEEINKEFQLEKDDVINGVKERIQNHKLTYAYRIVEKIKKEGYVEAHLNLAREYKEEAYRNRFKLEGYEDLELSTQILMRESIKRGIKVEILDRSENFISLKKNDNIQYVKQATKTSKDNYVTVLIMENKTVTKKVLRENNIKVPEGREYNAIEDAIIDVDIFKNKPVVVKPKSTNFGIGISIFPEGTSKEDLIEAMKIAFKHDNTVLVEEFVKGKEFRFLVIKDKVVGILHRVPANVVGDGIRSIRELVQEKNKDPLRGKGYVTPLEKINLDENARLFLKQRNLDFDYVPLKDEKVYLRENSNISTGGDSIDFTDDISPKYKKIAVEAAKAVKANICGVDMMLEDYKYENSNYAIIELNFNPAIHIHSFPYKGKEREIAKEILELLDLI